MIFIRNYLIWGAVKSVISVIFRAIYKVLVFFHLHLTLFCAVLGAVLEIAFGIVLDNDVSFAVFHVIMCLTLVYALVATVYKITVGGGKKPDKKERTAEIVQPPIELPASEAATEKPRYYRVKQNPKYVMAEFNDRYELYLESETGLTHIRTDYKGAHYGRNL